MAIGLRITVHLRGWGGGEYIVKCKLLVNKEKIIMMCVSSHQYQVFSEQSCLRKRLEQACGEAVPLSLILHSRRDSV